MRISDWSSDVCSSDLDDELAALRLVAQGHLQAEGADLLVQRVAEGAGTRAMRLATTDEDRRPAIAVTSRTAALLATELLAGARHIAAFAGGTSRTTALFELPGHDAVQDVGAGVEIGRAHVCTPVTNAK